MKHFILSRILNLVKKNKHELDDEELDVIRYGLEAIYINITKIFVISLLAYFLGIFKEMFFLMISYNVIRTFAFGLHATKSIYCYISSIFFFIGGTYLCIYLDIHVYIKLFIALISLICLYKYAPADTYKRPIVNVKKRKRFKTLSIIIGVIYTLLIIFYQDSIISNYLLVGLVEEVLLIHPLVYKMFGLPFDNYRLHIKSTA